MIFGGNYHSPHALFKNHVSFFLKVQGVLLLNQSPTRFATHFLRMMRTLRLKNVLRGTASLHDFISLNLSKEEGTVAMIKYYQSFIQRNIFIKMEKTLLILLRMVDSNHLHMEKLQFMVLMVDDHIRMSISDINDEEYFTPVTELEDDENEKGPGDDVTHEYLSDDEDVSNTEDGITYQDKNRLGGKILAVWERYKSLLEHDYSSAGYMLSVDAKKICTCKGKCLV